MNNAYLDLLREYAETIITHIALFDDTQTELTGGSPAYARKAVTWADDGTGTMRPNANLVFDIPAGATVAEWRAFTALTAGTDYGGALLTNEVFAGQGTYTLLAASSGIVHSAV